MLILIFSLYGWTLTESILGVEGGVVGVSDSFTLSDDVGVITSPFDRRYFLPNTLNKLLCEKNDKPTLFQKSKLFQNYCYYYKVSLISYNRSMPVILCKELTIGSTIHHS